MNNAKWKFLLAFSFPVLLMSCSAADDEENAQSSETTVETSVVESENVSNMATSTSLKPATSSTTELNIAGGNDPEDFLMPDVRCMNLQEAQDEIQDHGVFYSRSVDLSGQGRLQIVDSNWIVLEQTPAPGVTISEGEAILGVVKIGESTRGLC